VNGLEHLARFEEARRQVAVADAIVVSKLDLAGAMPRDLERALASLNPHARHAGADTDLFANARRRARLHLPRTTMRITITWRAGHRDAHDPPACAARLAALCGMGAMDAARARPNLLRMKGIVRMADGEIRALHAVMQLFSAPQPVTIDACGVR
jgi:G3E family GTPase